MVDVFISYPRAERARAEPIRDRLTALDLDVFFDLDGIDGGANFPDVIDRALKASKAVLCCWSPLYFTRPWCLIECRYALNEDVLTPVTLEAYERKAPPADLMTISTYDLTDWAGEDAHEDWNRTLRSLGKKLGRDLAQAPASAAAKADPLENWRLAWNDFPAKDDIGQVARFLEKVRSIGPGSGLEFIIEHHLEQLERAEAERRAEEARVQAEKEARAKEEARRAVEQAAAREKKLAASPAGTIFRDRLERDGEGPEMVVIPAGRFLMGSPADEPERASDEGPQHEVTIDRPFGLGRFAVTRGEFAAFVSATGHDMNPGWRWFNGKKSIADDSISWRDPGFAQDDRHPVVGVSWRDAQGYCRWLSEQTGQAYRLPSEAEWEYACRAGTVTPFCWGSEITPDQANYNGTFVYAGGGAEGVYRKKTEPVDAFEPNHWGLHQMHGNVWEWCQDAWNDTYAGAPSDGSAWRMGDETQAILRGGFWYLLPFYLRSANRAGAPREDRVNSVSFRLARTLGNL